MASYGQEPVRKKEKKEEKGEENLKEDFIVVEVKNHRSRKGRMEFEVLWAPCEDNKYRNDETTWEPEAQLRADGQGGMINAYQTSQAKDTKKRKREAENNGSSSLRKVKDGKEVGKEGPDTAERKLRKCNPNTPSKVGQEVEVEWNGKWYKANIIKTHWTGEQMGVQFKDGSSEPGVDISRLRLVHHGKKSNK